MSILQLPVFKALIYFTDDLLDHIEGRKLEQDANLENRNEQSSDALSIQVCICYVFKPGVCI